MKILLVLLISISLVNCGQNNLATEEEKEELLQYLSKDTVGHIKENNSWYNLKEKNFELSFPNQPKETNQDIKTSFGNARLKTWSYSSKKGVKPIYFSLSRIQYPSSLQLMVDEVDENNKLLKDLYRSSIDGGVNNLRGKIISEKTISLNQNEGRKVIFEFKNEGEDSKGFVNCFFSNSKLYVLQVLTTNENCQNTKIDKFLNSFKIN